MNEVKLLRNAAVCLAQAAELFAPHIVTPEAREWAQHTRWVLHRATAVLNAIEQAEKTHD